MEKDLTIGIDGRNETVIFIHKKHFSKDFWEIDQETKATVGNGLIQFRVIDDTGQTHLHGFIDKGEVVQHG